MTRGRPVNERRGAALLLAMVIVALVATVTAGMVWQQTRAVQVEAAERARAQAGWILSGALDWARLILREDLRNNRSGAQPHDSLDEPWATPLAEARLSTFLAADKDNNTDAGPEAFISGSISDAQARFNLRGLLADDGKVLPPQQAALDRLCSQAGAPTDTAQRIVQGLQASLFPEAEATASTAAGPPLRPGRLADLAWLGIDLATLARLSPLSTCCRWPHPSTSTRRRAKSSSLPSMASISAVPNAWSRPASASPSAHWTRPGNNCPRARRWNRIGSAWSAVTSKWRAVCGWRTGCSKNVRCWCGARARSMYSAARDKASRLLNVEWCSLRARIRR